MADRSQPRRRTRETAPGRSGEIDIGARSSLLDEAFEQAPISLMVTDEKCTILALNRAARTTFGCGDERAPATACGRLLRCRNATDTVSCGESNACPSCPLRKAILQTLESGRPLHGLRGVLRRRTDDRQDDRELHVGTALLEPQEQKRVLLSVSDVTQLRHFQPLRHVQSEVQGDEQRLAQENLGILSSLLDTCPAAITIHDTSGRFLYCNQEHLAIHGYSMEEMAALSMTALDVPESRAKYQERVALLEEKGQASFEVEHKRRDGSRVPLWIDARMATWGGQKVILSVASNLTGRKLAEAALRESEERFRRLYEHLPVSYQSLDADGRLIEVNQAWLTMMGYGHSDEVVGRWFGEFLSEEMVHKFQNQFSAFKSHGHTQVEFEMVRKDGSRLTAFFVGQIARDAQGHFRQTHCIATDVTEQRRLEEQYRQAQKMEAVGRLAAGVAHDFNNQLTVIRGYSDMIMRELATDNALWPSIVEISRAADRAKSTTSHLLSLSRAQPLKPELTAMGPALTEICKPVSQLIGEDIELLLEAEPGLWTVMVDQGALAQAIMNLVINARDAMPQGGRLALRGRNLEVDAARTPDFPGSTPGRYVLLEVEDSGTGMSQETLKHAFDPFFTTKEVGKGTGLGLPSVYGFVRQSNGFVTIASRPGHGTSVRLLLPASAAAETAKPDEATPEIQPARPGTVLVVEDEEGVRRIVVRSLERAGFKVLQASLPVEALQILADCQEPLDLLISDVVMPGMRGVELVRQVQKMRPELKALFMTGYVSEEMRATVENILHKPFGMDELVQRVRDLLEAP